MHSPLLPRSGRSTLVIAVAVVGFHVLALWALQSGLLRRVVEIVVPVEILSEVIEPPRPTPPPPPQPEVRRPPPQRVTQPVAAPTPPAPVLAPQLVVPAAIPESAPNAPAAVVAPPAPLPPLQAPAAQAEQLSATPPAPVSVAPRPPAPPTVELPSSDAEYLQNPRPIYPPMSKRLREQGTVLVRVLIGADGRAQKAEIQQSSEFDRLDQAALTTVLSWRYIPGKRGGKPEAMWFTVPITWVLQ